jgi:hypothetical protein
VFTAGSSIVTLFRHTPGSSETSMELWGGSDDTTPELGRVAAGSAWAAVALADAIASASDMRDLVGVSFNGKLFLPYNSAVDRMHVWDGSSVRRMGLATPAAATVANTGAGAYAATLRYYKVAWVAVDGVGNLLLSPLSASVSLTPSGAGTAARVTRPALAGEHETGWHLFGSLDNINYYLIAEVASGTTTYDDSTAPASYNTLNPLASVVHTLADYFTRPISAKYLLVDGKQLLLAGSHETTALSSTVYFTPALNSSGATTTGGVTRTIADDERVPSTNQIPIDPQLGGGITGMGGPIGGAVLVFKRNRTYALIPTNDVTLPYVVQLLSASVGCVSHRGIVMAEDEHGAPALYWPAVRGLYRYGAAGMEYCSADIADVWANNVEAVDVHSASAAYHRDVGQLWVSLAGGVSSSLLKFHVERGRRTAAGVRGGWTQDSSTVVNGATALCMFAAPPGASMSLTLKPYFGVLSGAAVYRADVTGVHTDVGSVAYIARMFTRAFEVEMGQEFGVQTVYLSGAGSSGGAVSLTVSLFADQLTSSVDGTVQFGTVSGHVVAPGLETSECDRLYVRVTDEFTAPNLYWEIDRIALRLRVEAPKEA